MTIVQNFFQVSKMPWDLLIFDWDGTLADSTKRIIDAMQQAAQDCQQSVPDDKTVAAIIGLGLSEALARLFPAVSDYTCLKARYQQWFLYNSPYPDALFPGMGELLKDLQQAGFLLAVATGKSRLGLDRALRKNQVRQYFVYSRCADESASKPNPLMLSDILAACALAPQQACLVGDSVFDIQMAQALAIDVLAVGYGAGQPAALQALNPTAYFANPSDLISFLQKTLTARSDNLALSGI